VGTRSRIEGLNVVVRRAKSRSSLKVTAKLTRLAASYSTEEALFLTNISSTRPGAEDRTRVCCCRRGLESSVIAHCFDLHPKMHPNCNFRKYPQDRFRFTRPAARQTRRSGTSGMAGPLYRLPIGPSPLISRKSRSAARAQTGQSHTSTGANELSNRKRREFMVATWPRSPAGPIPDSEGAALP
jgi:hypothetical protein